VLTAIATTKSTVLGLRLDHDRRAWVETTAAAQGVSVRAVFEALIDRARAAEEFDEDEAAPGSAFTPGHDRGEAGAVAPGDGRTVAPGEGEPGPAGAAPPDGGTHRSMPSPLSGICDTRGMGFPGDVIEKAVSLAAALLESSGNYVRENWRIIMQALQ
jgi:hypothetical protein